MSKEAMKLVPVEPTPEMLKAMDECSKEGYDERLYAGHAASVYMAAIDAAPEQPAQQEPVAWMHEWEDGERIPKLHERDDRYRDQPKTVRPLVYVRTWVGLTHEEHMEIMTGTMTTSSRMAAVEAKLKEKNT